jgi:hypothetical protein
MPSSRTIFSDFRQLQSRPARITNRIIDNQTICASESVRKASPIGLGKRCGATLCPGQDDAAGKRLLSIKMEEKVAFFV